MIGLSVSQVDKSDQMDDGLIGDDYVKCKICGFIGKTLSSHIFLKHKINAAEYKKRFNVTQIISNNQVKILSKRMSGENNPWCGHGSELSPCSPKFKGKTNRNEVAKKISKSHKENGNSNLSLLYYTKRGYSEDEAKELISKRQSTFSLEKCIAKHGIEKGTEIWKKRQEKWQKSYKKSNFSKVSQNLFWEIFDRLDSNINKSNIFFAQLNKTDLSKDESGSNHELSLSLNNSIIKPDFILLDKKRIIEFDGDYWHSRDGNKKRELKRDMDIVGSGYTILHVKEWDFVKDKEATINQCLEFLYAEIN